jgi:transcriptional regulator with XRE-family HTH domain
MQNEPLSTRRRRLNLTQIALAHQLGLSRRQIQAYEMGEETHLHRVIMLAMLALADHPEEWIDGKERAA